jgi:hypothetical protein
MNVMLSYCLILERRMTLWALAVLRKQSYHL